MVFIVRILAFIWSVALLVLVFGAVSLLPPFLALLCAIVLMPVLLIASVLPQIMIDDWNEDRKGKVV